MQHISAIVIPTANRVESLERTLVSYIVQTKTFGHDVEFVVGDDSGSSEYRQHTRGLLRSIGRSHGVRIAYAGKEEKSTFAEALSGACEVPAALVAFGLLGDGTAAATGANRNALMLDTVGQLIYSADDDTVCRVARPAASEDAALDIHGLSQRVWDGHDAPADFIWQVFRDLNAALEATPTDDVDVLALHERLLGLPVSDIKGSFEKVKVRAELSRAQWTAPSTDASRVMFTMTGLIGDVGVDERWHLLSTSPGALSQLLDENLLQLSLDSRIALKCTRRTTLTRWVGLHGMFFGADNRSILPPFFPLFRGQDSLMGWMARQCYPRDLFGFLPRALLHVPPPRAYARGFEYLLCNHTLANIIVDIIKSERSWPTPEAALDAMARALLAVGSMPLPDFIEALRRRWRADAHPGIPSYIASLQHQPAARNLRDRLERVVETRQASRANDDGSLPFDVREGRQADEARAATQALIRQFGELVGAWPTLVQASRDLRSQGVRVAVPLS
jgi:hypothetical protein